MSSRAQQLQQSIATRHADAKELVQARKTNAQLGAQHLPGVDHRLMNSQLRHSNELEIYGSKAREASTANMEDKEKLTAKVKAGVDEVRLELESHRQLAEKQQLANSDAKDAEVQESVDIVNQLIASQPHLGVVLQHPVSEIGRQLWEQREVLHEGLKTTGQKVEALEKKLTDALDLCNRQRSEEEARHQEVEKEWGSLKEEYLKDRTAWTERSTSLTGAVNGLTAEKDKLTRTVVDEKAKVGDAEARLAKAEKALREAQEADRLLRARLDDREVTMAQVSGPLSELLAFRNTVLRWHGSVSDADIEDLGQEFMEVAKNRSRLHNGPVMSHSLDGLHLTYAGDSATTCSIREQMIRFWCQCRVGHVDLSAANNMLNGQLIDGAGWSAVPFLYKAIALLLQQLTQVSGPSLKEMSERHLTLLLRGLLCMATLGEIFPAVIPADVDVPALLSEVEFRIMAWLYSNPSSLASALLSVVQQAVSVTPTPLAHHGMVRDAVRTGERYLDSSNSDLQGGISLMVNISRKSFLLVVDNPTTAMIQFNREHIQRFYCEELSLTIELDPTSMKLPENMQTLCLGEQPNVNAWFMENLL